MIKLRQSAAQAAASHSRDGIVKSVSLGYFWNPRDSLDWRILIVEESRSFFRQGLGHFILKLVWKDATVARYRRHVD